MKCLSLFLSAILGLSLTKVGANPCPPPEEIFPCTCEPGSTGYPVIRCNKLKNITQLGWLSTISKGQAVEKLIISNSSLLGPIPGDIFKGITLSALLLERTNVSKIGSAEVPAFQGQQGSIVDILIFAVGQVVNVTFANMQKLEYFSMSGCAISNLGPHWFLEGLENMKDLSLYDNGIESIGNQAFSKLTGLEFLDLSYNQIRDVQRRILPWPASHLYFIELSDNKIQHLPNDFFIEMPNLREVYLAGNEITTLPEATWSKVWKKLVAVWLEGNPLICDNRIAWIYKRDFPDDFWGECTGSGRLDGKQLQDLTLKDLVH
ncbi:lumican-like [Tachypleus tridentatus]|uniref:lumican-like n=1 Tax=Tachypleus tridentatus TaxID=6853 RepID=UPI003FCF0A30